jgi:CHASE3 domain sensor protein
VRQRNKLLAYLCTGVVLLLLFAAEEVFILQQWHQTLEAQQQRSALREEVLRLRRLVADIDSGFRGYALMRQSMFLAPMVAAEAELPQAMQRLSDLTVDMPSLQGGVQVLRRRLDELVDSKRRLTGQIDNGKQEEALAYIRTGNGVALAKTVANVFDDLDMKIEHEFKDADLSQSQKQTKTMWQLVMAQAGVMFVGVLVMQLLLVAFAEPQRQEI